MFSSNFIKLKIKNYLCNLIKKNNNFYLDTFELSQLNTVHNNQGIFEQCTI